MSCDNVIHLLTFRSFSAKVKGAGQNSAFTHVTSAKPRLPRLDFLFLRPIFGDFGSQSPTEDRLTMGVQRGLVAYYSTS